MEFMTQGVCARKISFDIVDGKIYNVKFFGGCDGNHKAIARLIEGKDAKMVSELLKGNTCGYRQTSCGDQLAIAIEEALK